jgi:hypothetical protein
VKFRHQKNHYVGGKYANQLSPSIRWQASTVQISARSLWPPLLTVSAEQPASQPPTRLAAHPSNRRARAGLVARQSGPETVALPVRYIPPFFSPRLHLRRPEPVGDFQSTARISQKNAPGTKP